MERALPVVVLLQFLVCLCGAIGTISLLPGGVITVPESALRGGTASLRLQISGDTWVTPMDNTIRNALISGFVEVSRPSSASFSAMRSSLLKTFSFGVTSSVITVTFEAVPSFDAAANGRVRIGIPSSAVASGVSPHNVVFFNITAERAAVALGAAYTFTEAQIRAGGMSLAIVLSTPEVWANTSRMYFRTVNSNVTLEPLGFDRFAQVIIARRASIVTPSTATFVLRAAPLFDISRRTVVRVTLQHGSVASALLPEGLLEFTIEPTAGAFWFPKPLTVAERSIYELGHVRLLCTLDYGESWSHVGVNTSSVRAQLHSLQAEPNGFNNRKAIVIHRANLTSSRTLQIDIGVDPHFDIAALEEIVFAPLGYFVASGIRPTVRVGTTVSDRWTIVPSPCRLVTSTFTITERSLVEGGSVTLTIFRGETWDTSQSALWITSMTSSTPAVPFDTNWNARRSAIVNTSSFVVSGSSTAKQITILWRAFAGYDTAFTETITISMNMNFVASKLAPTTTTVSIIVTPSPDLLAVSHSAVARGTGGRFHLTEAMIRAGGGTFNFGWMQSLETWVGRYISILNVTRISGDVGWRYGFAERALSGAILRSSSAGAQASLAYTNGMKNLTLTLRADTEYDTATTELLRFTIPRRSIRSGLPSNDGREFYEFTVSPVGGNVSLACCNVVEEADLHEGRVVLVFRLASGETWVSGFEAQWRHAVISSQPSEPYGFMQNVAEIMAPTKISLTNDSHDVRVAVGAVPSYDLRDIANETITVRFFTPHFPQAAVRSGLGLTPLQLSFTIVKSPPGVNFSFSEQPITERRLREGGWRIRAVLRSYDSWISSAVSSFITAFSGNSGPTGFNASRAAMLVPAFVSIPATHFAHAATARFQGSQNYEINATETITVALPASLFRSGMAAAPFRFTVAPSRGTLVATATRIAESDVVAGRWGSRGSTERLVIRIALEPIEKWSRGAAAMVYDNITGSCHLSTCFRALKHRILPQQGVTIEGQDLVLRFSPASTFDISGSDNITVHFDRSHFESGLVPSVPATGALGRVTIAILPSAPTIAVHNATWHERAVFDITAEQQAATAVIRLRGDRFSSLRSHRMRCVAAFLASTRVSTRSVAEGDAVMRRLRTLLNVTFDSRSDSTMLVRFARSRAPFDITSTMRIMANVSAVCTASGLAPRNGLVVITVVPSVLASVSVEPPFITESDIRGGNTTVVFRLPHYEQFASNVRFVLDTFAATAQPRQLLTSGGRSVGVGPTSAPWASQRLQVLTGVLRRRWSVLRPHFAWLDSRRISMTIPNDPTFDIARDERVEVLQRTGNLSSVLNLTSVDRRLGRRVETLLENARSQFVVDVRVSPAQAIVKPARLSILEREVRFPLASSRRHGNVSLALDFGEEWVDTHASRQAIFDSITASSQLGRNAVVAKLIGSPGTWRLSSSSRVTRRNDTFIIPLRFGDAEFEILQDELVRYRPPASAVISGLVPHSSLATFTVLADNRDRFIVAPAVITESMIRTRPETLIVVRLGTKPGMVNDTWTPMALSPGTVTLFNATLQARAAAPSNERGFFGTMIVGGMRTRLSLHRQELRIAIQRQPHFRIFSPEKIFIRLRSDAVTTRNVPGESELYFRVVPSRAVLSVSLHSTDARMPRVSTATAPTPLTEHAIQRGQLLLNLTLSSDERFVDSATVRALLRSSTFGSSAPSGVFGASMSTLLDAVTGITIAPQQLLLRLGPDPSFDISALETVTLRLFPSLFPSQIVPEVTGFGAAAPLSGAIVFYVTPSRGTLARATTVPSYVQEATLRRGIALHLTLERGETWNLAPASFYSAVVQGISTLNNVSGSYFASSANIRRLVPLNRVSIDPTSAGRTLVLRMNDTNVVIDGHTQVLVRIPAAATRSGLGLMNPVASFNVTDDPPRVTFSRRSVAAPSVRVGTTAFTAELRGDAWVAEPGRYLQFRVIRRSRPTDGNGVVGDPAQHSSIAERLTSVFHPFVNVTRDAKDDSRLVVSLGPDPSYNPFGTEVIEFFFTAFTTQRMQQPEGARFNFSITVPSLEFNVSTPLRGRLPRGVGRLTMNEIRRGGVTIDAALENDEFLSGCASHVFAVGSSGGPAPSITGHLHELINVTTVRNARTIRIVLSAIKDFRPCSTLERLWLMLPTPCFQSANKQPIRIPLEIASPNITISSTVGKVALVSEAALRRGGVTFNFTLPIGEWTEASLSWFVNQTAASGTCSTCFLARRQRILGARERRLVATLNSNSTLARWSHPFNAVEFVGPRSIMVRTFPDMWYNAPAGGEIVYFNGLERGSLCQASPVRFSIRIGGSDPVVTSWSEGSVPGHRLRHVVAHNRFTFNVSGYELNPRQDRVVAIPIGFPCRNLTLSNPGKPVPLAAMRYSVLSSSQPQEPYSGTVTVAMAINFAGDYRICYQPNGPRSPAVSIQRYVDLSELAAPASRIFIRVTSTVRRQLLVTPMPMRGGLVPLGTDVWLHFSGAGLRTIAGADAAKVVLVEPGAHPNCSASAVAMQRDLEGNLFGNATATAKVQLFTSGRLAVCYRLHITTKYALVGSLNTTEVMAGLSQRHFEPFAVPHAVGFRGLGFDTRFDRVRVVVHDPDVPLPCTSNLSVVAASSWWPHVPVVNFVTQSRRTIYSFAVPAISHLLPRASHSQPREHLNITHGLPPGNYTVCRSHRLLSGLMSAWRDMGTIRVFSGVRIAVLRGVQRNGPVRRLAAGSSYVLHVEGIGFTSAPTAAIALRARVGGGDCTAPSSGALSAVQLGPLAHLRIRSDALLTGTIDFPTMGQIVLCFTSAERHGVLTRAPTNETYIVFPTFGEILGSRSSAGGETVINVTGRGLDPTQLRAVLVLGVPGLCPSHAALLADPTQVGFNESTMRILANASSVTPLRVMSSYPPWRLAVAGTYSVCLASLGEVVRVGAINVTANVTGLAQQLFEPHVPFRVRLVGHGFDSKHSQLGGDAIAVVASPSSDSYGDCSDAAHFLSLTADIDGSDSSGLTSVDSASMTLRAGNYTACYSSFPDFRFSPVARFRVMSLATAVAPLRFPAVVGEPFVVRLHGEDLAAQTSTVRVRFLLDSLNCTDMAAHSLAPTSLSANYSSMTVAFNSSVMGLGTICWSTEERGHANPIRFDSASFVVLPKIDRVAPQLIYACGATPLNVSGLGMDASRMNLTVVSSGNACANESAVVAQVAFDVSAPSMAVSLPVTLAFSGEYRICLGVLNVTFVQSSLIVVEPAVYGVTPRTIEPFQPSSSLTVIGCGFDTRAGEDALHIAATSVMESFADCTATDRYLVSATSVAPSGSGTRGASSAIISGVSLTTQNYTLCFVPSPRRVPRPLVNFRAMSVVNNIVHSKSIYAANDGPVSFNVQGTPLRFPGSARPVLWFLHNSDRCEAIDLAQQPVTQAPVTAVPAEMATVPGQMTLTPEPLPTPVPYTGEPLRTFPTDRGISFFSDLAVNATFVLPVMGIYTLCWTTMERNFVFRPLIWPNAVVEGVFLSFEPAVIPAGVPTSITIKGIGLFGSQMNASIAETGSPCSARDMTLRFSPTTSPFSEAVTSTQVIQTVSNGFQLCVGGVRMVISLGDVFVNATVTTWDTPIHVEQFETFDFKINGSGLTLQDKVLVTRFGCNAISQSLPIVTAEPRTVGIQQVQFSLDTLTVGTYSVCYQAVNDVAPRTLGVVVIDPEVKRIDSVTATPNPSGDRITFAFTGRGINTTVGGDAFRVISSPLADCTSAFAPVMFQVQDLQPTDAFHLRTAIASWDNSSFPTHPVVNTTLCFRHYGAIDFVFIGSLVLPFANQRPSFSFASDRLILYSARQSSTAQLQLARDISAGPAPIDAAQTVVFQLAVNDTSLFVGGVAPLVSPAGLLTASLVAKAVGALQITLTVVDDGGVAFGGADRFVNFTNVRVIYPFNTAPLFALSSAVAPVWQNASTVSVLSRFLVNISGGSNEWEQSQRVTFTVTVRGNFSDLITAISIADSGDLSISVDVARTSQLTRSALVTATIVARDDGGTGTNNDEVDAAPPRDFTVVIAVLNNAPTVSWQGHPDRTLIAVAGVRWRRSVLSGISANDPDQSVVVRGGAARANPLDNVPFRCEVGGDASTGTLEVTCDRPGNYTLAVFVVDSGGSHLQGSDTSPSILLTLLVVNPYALTITPASGGLSQASTFTFSVGGGLPEVDRLGTRARFYIVEGTPAVPVEESTSKVLVRDFGPLIFQTKSLPSGSFMYFVEVIDFHNDTIAFSAQMVSVAEMPRTVSFATVERELRVLLAANDFAGVAFGLVSVGLALSRSNSLDAVAERAMFIVLLDETVQRHIATATQRVVPGPALLQYAAALAYLANTRNLPIASLGSRRRLMQQAVNEATLPHATVLIATRVVAALSINAELPSVTREASDRLAQCVAVLAHSVPQKPQFVWRRFSDRYAADEPTRRAQNAAAVALIAAAHNVLELECLRMQATLALTPFAAVFENSATMFADLITESQLVRTVQVADLATTRDIVVRFAFPRGNSLSCAMYVGLSSLDAVLGSGDPAEAPWTPVISVAAASIGSGRPAPNPEVEATLSFGTASAAVNASAAGPIHLLAFNNQSGLFERVDAASQRPEGFQLGATVFQAARHGSNFAILALNAQPSRSSTVTYVAVILPLVVVLLVAHIVVSWKVDRPMRGRRLIDDFFDIEKLHPMSPLEHLANNTIFAAPFVRNCSFRMFARHHRAICLWFIIISPFGVMTGVLEIGRVDWEYEATRDVDVARLLNMAIPLSLVGHLLSRVSWWLFTSSPREPLSMQGQRMSLRDKKIIAALALFIFWTLGCLAFFVATGVTFNSSAAVEESYIAILLCIACGVVWEIWHASTVTFLVPKCKPQVARRYIHPSVLSWTMEDHEGPFGMSPRGLEHLQEPMLQIAALETTVTGANDDDETKHKSLNSGEDVDFFEQIAPRIATSAAAPRAYTYTAPPQALLNVPSITRSGVSMSPGGRSTDARSATRKLTFVETPAFEEHEIPMAPDDDDNASEDSFFGGAATGGRALPPLPDLDRELSTSIAAQRRRAAEHETIHGAEYFQEPQLAEQPMLTVAGTAGDGLDDAVDNDSFFAPDPARAQHHSPTVRINVFGGGNSGSAQRSPLRATAADANDAVLSERALQQQAEHDRFLRRTAIDAAILRARNRSAAASSPSPRSAFPPPRPGNFEEVDL